MEIESQTSRSYQDPTSVPVIFSFLMVKERRRLVEMAKSSILWRFMRSCIVVWGAKHVHYFRSRLFVPGLVNISLQRSRGGKGGSDSLTVHFIRTSFYLLRGFIEVKSPGGPFILIFIIFSPFSF